MQFKKENNEICMCVKIFRCNPFVIINIFINKVNYIFSFSVTVTYYSYIVIKLRKSSTCS